MMTKMKKFACILAIAGTSGYVWAAGVAIDNSTGTAVKTTTVSAATETNLEADVVLKTSKGVIAGYDVSQGGGAVGTAAGSVNGKGFVYINGTSTTQTNLDTQSVMATTSNVVTFAQSAAS